MRPSTRLKSTDQTSHPRHDTGKEQANSDTDPYKNPLTTTKTASSETDHALNNSLSETGTHRTN